MGLETGVNFIDDLVATNPLAGDDPSEGDDHIRAIKTAVQGSFTSLGSAAVTKTAAEINDLVEQTNPVLNGTITGTAFLDDDTMAADSAVAVASQQSIKAYTDSKLGVLSRKVIEIGDWNMDTDGTKTGVAHGLTYANIRGVSATIRNDADTGGFSLDGSGRAGYNTVNISLARTTSGDYDNSGFSTTSYNRGWVTIEYIA